MKRKVARTSGQRRTVTFVVRTWASQNLVKCHSSSFAVILRRHIKEEAGWKFKPSLMLHRLDRWVAIGVLEWPRASMFRVKQSNKMENTTLSRNVGRCISHHCVILTLHRTLISTNIAKRTWNLADGCISPSNSRLHNIVTAVTSLIPTPVNTNIPSSGLLCSCYGE